MAAKTITLAEARCYLNDISLQADINSAFSLGRLDRGMITALNELIRVVPNVTKTSSLLDITAYSPEVDLTTLSHFRPERFLWAKVQYEDQGTWADTISYVVNDLVIGDGTTDTKLWVCTTDHTATDGTNNPGTDGGGDFWKQVGWKEGFDIEQVDMTALENYYTFGDTSRFEFVMDRLVNNDTTTIAYKRPEKFAFRDENTVFLAPTDDVKWKLELHYNEPLLLKDSGGTVYAWTPGDQSVGGYLLNIPKEYVYQALAHGAAPYITHEDPGNKISISAVQGYATWLMQLKESLGGLGGHIELNERAY